MQTIDKTWDGLTIEGTLIVGILFAGARHKHFIMRIPMAGDLVSAQEDHPNAPLQVVTMATYHRQLLAVGDIPSESLTFDLIKAELAEIDLALLAAADQKLEERLAQPASEN
ncbi:conserved hypothetical protein [Pseudomonas sp. 8Z]|uniref:hypothetical protein n=1 Tax=Pseudomonas sp. 8Z TaxID=2653166 RepID=UPI0012F1C447|nr:hypothetical protein [Pseudomonas sp. 8Z]VXC29701.1 conserved hypothetical protein [Pseudomonas sp. 8Z]